MFPFVQFEFAFLLGPPDGRFVVRRLRQEAPERVLILATLAAPERRLSKGKRRARVTDAHPEAVPTSRATVIKPEPFLDEDGAGRWLEEVRGHAEREGLEVDGAVHILNRALSAHRAARADPSARDVAPDQALVVRLGFGAGEALADGQFDQAWELPHAPQKRVRRSMEAPEERFAALLGGREPVLVCEELVLRARADLSARSARAAALQTRVALESLLSEADWRIPDDRRRALEADRSAVGDAANAALLGDLDEEAVISVQAVVGRMEAALRVRRLESAS